MAVALAGTGEWDAAQQQLAVLRDQYGQEFDAALVTYRVAEFAYTNGRADRISSGLISDPSKTKWFDTSAFRPAAAFTVPTDSLSQPSLRTPWRNAVNWSFFKNNPIKERYNLQFRAEFYNIFNTPQFDVRGASTDVTNPLFGQITEGGGERNIQFGLRLTF